LEGSVILCFAIDVTKRHHRFVAAIHKNAIMEASPQHGYSWGKRCLTPGVEIRGFFNADGIDVTVQGPLTCESLRDDGLVERSVRSRKLHFHMVVRTIVSIYFGGVIQRCPGELSKMVLHIPITSMPKASNIKVIIHQAEPSSEIQLLLIRSLLMKAHQPFPSLRSFFHVLEIMPEFILCLIVSSVICCLVAITR